MIEKAETEYKELVHKKTVVENDKKKIEDVIGELDQKKNQTLQVCAHTSYAPALLWTLQVAVIWGRSYIPHGTVECQTSAL